jgi:hypothetical protein
VKIARWLRMGERIPTRATMSSWVDLREVGRSMLDHA